MKKFSIIIPCYKQAHLLSRCIGSILDQDWPEKEICVVLDGRDSTAEKILESFPSDKFPVKWTLTSVKGKTGAPHTRNVGANISTGDFIMYVDCDTVLYPGALRTYVETFEDNPDCGFIYSGYKYKVSKDSAGVYLSREFSQYQLESNNFIDGSNPMRREIALKYPWRESLKSLQDWDMWIRITKGGVKGKFLENQFFFEKDMPLEGSLSFDSHRNWLERRGTVQKLNKLPVRDIAMTSFAAMHHTERCAELMDFDSVDPLHLYRKPHVYKAVYLVGYFALNQHNPLPFMDGYNSPPILRKNITRIIHWIGSDILVLKSMPCSFMHLKGLVDAINAKFVQFCQTESNRKELEDIGIKSKVCPLPVDIKDLDVPLPKDFTVAIYDHFTNDIYCQPLIIEVIKSMPDINFIYFGSDEMKIIRHDLKNMKILGRLPIKEIISQASVLLRISKHDGFPVSPIEFLASGRQVLINHDFPYMKKIDGVLTDEKGIVEMKKNIMGNIRLAKKNVPPAEFFKLARSHYSRELNPKRLRKEVLKLI